MARTKKISLEEFVATVSHYRESRKKNPMLNNEFCAYTDPKNPERHCIFGQVMTDLGVPPNEEWEGHGADELLEGDLGERIYARDLDAVREIARQLQRAADRANAATKNNGWNGKSDPRPWNQAINYVTALVEDGSLFGFHPRAKAAWLEVFG